MNRRTQEYVSCKIGTTQPYLSAVLAGKSNFGAKKAKKASKLIGGEQIVWMDDTMSERRAEAWAEFKNGECR